MAKTSVAVCKEMSTTVVPARSRDAAMEGVDETHAEGREDTK
jgi:hypothetical protein